MIIFLESINYFFLAMSSKDSWFIQTRKWLLCNYVPYQKSLIDNDFQQVFNKFSTSFGHFPFLNCLSRPQNVFLNFNDCQNPAKSKKFDDIFYLASLNYTFAITICFFNNPFHNVQLSSPWHKYLISHMFSYRLLDMSFLQCFPELMIRMLIERIYIVSGLRQANKI